eukprot:GSChrysophyteH1.ASY1.ANO1.2218.1 assembled CDS
MKKHLVKLQAFATECTDLLPSYDLKRVQEILEELSRILREREVQLKPKKKFRFKSRDKLKEQQLPSAAGDASQGDSEMSKSTNSNDSSNAEKLLDTSYSVCNLSGKELVLDRDTIGMANGAVRSLHIKDCVDCRIFARCVLGSVRIESCKGCSIYLGPTRTSVYLDKTIGGAIYIAAHQLRIHECKDVSLCVRCNSHPIIEDCEGMGFAPYEVDYPQLTQHFTEASLREARCWDNVVDFRWHRTSASPNWRVLPPGERPFATKITEKDGSVTVWGSRVPSAKDEKGSIAARRVDMLKTENTKVFNFAVQAEGSHDGAVSDNDSEDEL